MVNYDWLSIYGNGTAIPAGDLWIPGDDPWWWRVEPAPPPRKGDGIKALRAAVRSTRPIDEPRRLEPRLMPVDDRRKGRPRRGRAPRGRAHG